MNNEVIAKIERVVLSAIFFDQDMFDIIFEKLSHNDFATPLHKSIFKAFETLHKGNKIFAPEIVCMEVQKDMPNITLDDISVVVAESPIADINSYIGEIKNASINRSLFSLASFIRDESVKNGAYALDTLQEVEKKIYSLNTDNTTSDFRTGEEIIESTLAMLEKIKELHGSLRGIDTGFAKLNMLTTGFNAGELIIIGARPGMGKTALILSMTLKIVSSGKGVAIFSLEMPAEQLMLRMLSAKSRIPMQSMRSADLDDKEWEKLTHSSQDLCEKNNLYIDDGSGLTLSALRTKLRKLISKDPSVSIVMIDYLQLMNANASNNNASRYMVISEISRGLKLLARELNVPIIALSQLNRDLDKRDDKKPIMSDLRDSGSIEQDADIIIFLYRDALYKARESRIKQKEMIKKKNNGENVEIPELYKAPETEEAELILAKNRNGAADEVIKVSYHKKFTLFEDIGESEITDMSNINVTKIDLSSLPNL